jgi:hypothetical protein
VTWLTVLNKEDLKENFIIDYENCIFTQLTYDGLRKYPLKEMLV